MEMFNRSERLCLLLKSNGPIEIPKLESRMEKIIARVGRFSGMPISAGISGVFEDSMNFSQMYDEATRALEYRGAIGGQKVFFFGDSSPVPSGKLLADDLDVQKLRYLLRFKSLEECEEHLSGLQKALDEESAKNSYYYIITGILNTLLRSCNDLEGLYAGYFGQHTIYRRLFESKTTDEAFGYLSELAGSIRLLNDNIIVGNMESNLQKILSYMETHFQDPNLSLESLAFEVSISVSYIGALLKKNMGTSFIKHLTALRMDKAKELLNNPEMKIIDIAEHLGYIDPYYFSHCFKKYTGVSPKDFRRSE
jgi:two-component system response regulator YesN